MAIELILNSKEKMNPLLLEKSTYFVMIQLAESNSQGNVSLSVFISKISESLPELNRKNGRLREL